MKNVIYPRVPLEYFDMNMTSVDVSEIMESREGKLLTIVSESLPNPITGASVTQTVAYIVDSDDGRVSRVSPTELIFVNKKGGDMKR